MQIEVKLYAFRISAAYLLVIQDQPFQLAAFRRGNLLIQ